MTSSPTCTTATAGGGCDILSLGGFVLVAGYNRGERRRGGDHGRRVVIVFLGEGS